MTDTPNGDSTLTDIPKDANGDPVFLALPDGVRSSYERRMARCEAGWLTSGDPAFVAEAEVHAHLHRRPSPLWLSEAVIELCAKRRTKGYAKRVLEAAVRWARYEAVRDALARGMTWEAAFEAAAESLSHTGAAGSASMMRDAYFAVVEDLKNGRGDQYRYRPLTPKKKLGDVLRRRPPD
jgi:hypothetical protein